MLSIVIAVVFSVLISFCVVQNKKKDPKKIFGIYNQRGKWFYLKYLTFLTIITLRQIKNRYFTKRRNNPILTRNVDILEKLQPLSNHEKAIDAVFFQAVNKEGYYICTGLERRHKGKANGLFYLVVPGIGLLGSEKLPSTLLNADPVSLHRLREYSAEGIRLTPIQPMRKWKIAFEGNMKNEQDVTEKKYYVKFEGEWTSNLPFFLYETDMSKRALARAIAGEKWTKEYFQALERAHQTHYEQIGKMTGKLIIDDKEHHQLAFTAFRDHSFAHKRDWSLMYRYIYNMLYMDNGLVCIIGVVSQPCTSSQIELGYVLETDKTLHAIEYCNLKLYQHGENGKLPKNFAFTFIANGNVYDANVIIEYKSEHFKGHENEARLIECFVSVDVNGIKGRGISEWHYNVMNQTLK